MAFVLCPGEVLNKRDGKMLFVSARRLAALYGVDFRDCRVWRPEDRSYRDRPEDIFLHPRYDGNYSLPETN